jgi:hypothetical protein
MFVHACVTTNTSYRERMEENFVRNAFGVVDATGKFTPSDCVANARDVLDASPRLYQMAFRINGTDVYLYKGGTRLESLPAAFPLIEMHCDKAYDEDEVVCRLAASATISNCLATPSPL